MKTATDMYAAAIATQKKVQDNQWSQAVDAAAKAGEFPKGVVVTFLSEPRKSQLKNWSNEWYTVVLKHNPATLAPGYEPLSTSTPYRHEPEHWVATIQEQKKAEQSIKES